MHHTKVDCFKKVIELLNEFRERRILKGKLKPEYVRLITAIQAKISLRKGVPYLLFKLTTSLKLKVVLEVMAKKF